MDIELKKINKFLRFFNLCMIVSVGPDMPTLVSIHRIKTVYDDRDEGGNYLGLETLKPFWRKK